MTLIFHDTIASHDSDNSLLLVIVIYLDKNRNSAIQCGALTEQLIFSNNVKLLLQNQFALRNCFLC